VLEELREGLNSAYRQLRELLTTFRLRIEGEGLAAALQTTVTEFSETAAAFRSRWRCIWPAAR
jgi:two-component system, NarL family, nitrate/nitrite sensor histidine kinase NarX